MKRKFNMSHHFVTVCVVCVLCAAHTPCSAHTDFSKIEQMSSDSMKTETSPVSNERPQPSWTSNKSEDVIQPKDRKTNTFTIHKYGSTEPSEIQAAHNNKQFGIKLVPKPVGRYHSNKKMAVEAMKKNVSHTDSDIDTQSTNSLDVEVLERLGQVELLLEQKLNSVRSAKDHINKVRMRRDTNIDGKYFMQKIFEAYGDGTSVTIEGFEKLLRKLGLLKLLADASDLKKEAANASQTRNRIDNGNGIQNKGLNEGESGSIRERCLSSKELLTTVAHDAHHSLSTNDNSTTLPGWLFERVCPALVYQLAGESSSERNGCIRVPEHYKTTSPLDDYEPEDVSNNMVQVWVYSTISIIIISLCGLLGVAVIPVMGKSYYNQLLQFLVALAVGTLCGDALIHLLPHAMMAHGLHGHQHEHTHDREQPYNSDEFMINHEELHNLNMWRGLVAMLGLVLFFFTEKALMMVAEWRKQRQRRQKLPSRVRVMRETDAPNSTAVGEKLCKHKYSSYPYCYGEITTDTQDNHHNRQHNHQERPPIIEEEKPLTSNCNSVSKIMTNDVEKKTGDDWRLDDSVINNAKKCADGADVPLSESESYTVIIREHETKHHGHTHSHGHVHSAPESMSSVAWMVVMGDGLHNFTDGMAIGAAFSANIAGGFSTAIAVFCHELPHELGDFAVLLKAGMSAKQAVFYNLLSSVLCLFGMVFGVLLGSTPAASSWMFAAAAGMFIYIALVDMIPELSTNHSVERDSQWQCVLQALGLLLGLGIMLIIALYEHDLKNIFSD